jgi:hypothetical protein
MQLDEYVVADPWRGIEPSRYPVVSYRVVARQLTDLEGRLPPATAGPPEGEWALHHEQ